MDSIWQPWKKKVKKYHKMDQDKKKLEEYLLRLQQLEAGINEDSDDDELMKELNGIIDSLTKQSQVDIIKDSINARLKFINKSNNLNPFFAKEGDSGFDIRAFVSFPIIIPPGKIKLIQTGLYFEVEKGLEVQIRSRSGLAANKGIMVLNSPGTVDSGYRGEIKIILGNFGEFALSVNSGDRIAQGVVCPVYGEGKLELEEVKTLSESERGDGGFGHSGVK